MKLNKQEMVLLYALLRKHEKELEKEIYTLKYRLEKELFNFLTIEEIQALDNKAI